MDDYARKRDLDMAYLLNMRRSGRRAFEPAFLLALPAAAALLLSVGPGRQDHVEFLQQELGRAAPSAPLVRRPMPGLRVALERSGYEVQSGNATVSLSAESTGAAWRRFTHGVERATPFGRETIVVGRRTTEEFLTVERRQGPRSWRWRLRTGGLTPRLNPDGSIAFHDGALADLSIEPVRILDASGQDVTPDGLRWSVERDRAGWALALALDDEGLPLPYVIDPAITLRGAASSANNGGGSASLTINRPGGVVAGDFLLALVNARGGTSRVITEPAGWTLVRRDNNTTDVAQAVYWRVATSSEPLSYAWTFNASVKATGGILPYVGVDSVSPIDVSSGNVNASSSSSATALSVTTTAPSHRVVGFFGIDGYRTWGPPFGMTERWDARAGNGANSIASEAADMTTATTGATGSKTATASGGGMWVAQLVALRVDATPPPVPTQSISESAPDSHVIGSTFYYRPAGLGGTFTVTSTASDPESGVAMVTFPGLAADFTPTASTDDTTAPYTQTYSWATDGGEFGPQTVTVTDNAGNSTDGDFTVLPDPDAPATTDNTAAIGSAWRNTAATVTLSPTDAGAGVATTYYTTDGLDPTTLSPQGTSVAVSGEGVHTVKYFSTDNVANSEAVQTAGTQIRIDTTAPTSATLDPLPALVTEPQVLSGSGTDGLSGVGSIAYYYCAGPPCAPSTFIGSSSTGPGYSFTWSDQPPDGNYAVVARVYDAAGNTLDSAPQSITIDNAPDTTIDSGPTDPTSSTSATFTFSANEAPVTFECQLDGGGFAICTTPQSYAGLSEGAHVFQARATDSLGNVGTAETYPWIIDRTPPNTTVDSGPANPTNATSATFTFSASELGSTFECSLDGAAFVPCATPKLYTGLAGGSHTFEVRATDPATNLDMTPASYTWSIDVTAPTASIDSVPADPTNATSATFTFSANELGSTFECQLDAGGYATCASPKSYVGVPAGVHTFDVRATDPVGNAGSPATDSWTIDLTAPDTSIASGPSDPTGSSSATFTFSASEPGSTFACQLDGGGYAPCTSPRSYSGLGTGVHTFNVRATDPAGNTDGTPATQTWTVDLGPPFASVDSGPADPTNSTTPTFTFSASEPGSTFDCQLDAGAWAACTTPKSYSGVAEGIHTFRVRAIDGVGNVGPPAAHTWRIDVTPPDSTVDSGPPSPTNATTAAFTFSGSEAGSTFQCQLDAGAYAPCTSPRSYAGLSDGSHTFRVKATDALGNIGSAATFSWSVDTAPPSASLGDPGANLSTTVALTASASDASGIQSVRFERSPTGTATWATIDSDAVAPYSINLVTNALADGFYDLRAIAVDAAGNTAVSALVTRRIDNTAPTASVAASQVFARAAIDLTATVSDDGSGVASTTFERAPRGSGSWTTIATVTAAPYTGRFDPAGLPEGQYDLRAVVTDAAGNVARATTSVIVATSGLSVALADPGSVLTGMVPLAAATGGVGGQQVVFELKRSTTDTWMVLSVDTAAPWSALFDTQILRDGRYDLRATTVDADGVSASDARTGIVVDNTAPSLVSSSRAAGAQVPPGAAVVLTASEPLARLSAAELDGSPTKAPAIADAKATFALGKLAPGAHTLSGRLHDRAGLSAPFTLRFTVVDSLFTARLGAPSRKAASVTVRVTVSKAATLHARLVSPAGKTIASRRTSAQKGTTRLAFRLPATAKPGRYTIVVRAAADGRSVTKRVAFAIRKADGRKRGGTWVIVRRP